MKSPDSRPEQTPAPGRRRAASLGRLLSSLKVFYGRPERQAVTDPFEQILYENVAYLADDARRAEAFQMLKEKVGSMPQRILDAPDEVLRELGARGILPAASAEKLREAARIAAEEFDGKLAQAIRRLPLREAKKALRRFPSIGEPGAEKILVFAGRLRALGLDSNGLRVMVRLGYGREGKNYPAKYRSAQEAAAPELPAGSSALIEASQLLRRHGQTLCKTSHPLCDACPVRADCTWFLRLSRNRA